MVTKRILLFGGSGQVGKTLQSQALPAGWALEAPARAACDFLKPGDIGRAMRAFKPDLVINAAAMDDIDACEADRDPAMHVNFDAVAQLAGQCVEHDAPLVQLSTDHVFDGRDGERPYRTDDAMNPLNVYGQSKMMGEEAARHGTYWHVILRTSLVFGAQGDNALTRSVRQIETQGELAAMIDQVACPTGAIALAQGLIRIADTILSGKAHCFGTFHLCGTPPVSRYDFIRAIAEEYEKITGNHVAVTGVSAADMLDRAPRPAYSALNCDRLSAIYGIEPRQWRDELAEAMRQYIARRATEG